MFCSHVRYVCLYVCMYVCMHVCTKSFLKTTTNSSCVCTHLANKADSDSDSDSGEATIITQTEGNLSLYLTDGKREDSEQETDLHNICQSLFAYVVML